MNAVHALILFAIIVGSLWAAQITMELFESPGTITQMVAQGPQDWYLTDWPEDQDNDYDYEVYPEGYF